MRKRFASRFSDIAAILPLCNEATFYDNNNGFLAVAEYKNGDISLIGRKHPRWILELCDLLGQSH